jgi:hypothetical protein
MAMAPAVVIIRTAVLIMMVIIVGMLHHDSAGGLINDLFLVMRVAAEARGRDASEAQQQTDSVEYFHISIPPYS